jgi:surfeit locus 1 family protein
MTGISFGPYRFEPRIIPTLAAFFLCVLTISLGNWQTRRAEEKMALQQRLDAYTAEAPIKLAEARVIPADVADHRVSAQGQFVAERTVFIDNRVHQGVPGYHIVTPLRIEGSAMHVLVNRGWIAAGADRTRLPEVKTPAGTINIEGTAVVPLSHPYELAPDATKGPLRQNLVPERMEAETSMAMQPIVLLQTSVASDGLVREWPKPNAGVDTHRAYALQWYVMALVTLGLWIGLNLHKAPSREPGA